MDVELPFVVPVPLVHFYARQVQQLGQFGDLGTVPVGVLFEVGQQHRLLVVVELEVLAFDLLLGDRGFFEVAALVN